MSITVHQRPGVYSSYDASRVVSGSGAGRLVGLAGVNTTASAGVAQTITSYDQAVTAFGSSGAEDMAELIRLALANGASGVVAVPVASAADYQDAFDLLAETEDIALVICDSTDEEVQADLRDSVAAASEARRERLAVVAGAKDESVADLVERAKGLNNERVVLVAPGGVDSSGTALSGLTLAAAVAGAIAGESDPALPLGGAELLGLGALELLYSDSEVDLLVQGGVTPVETVAGQTSVIRGATTRTKTGEAADATWRELTTILIVDEVIHGIRDSLRSRFTRSKNTAQTREAIRSHVVLELEDRLRREIITGYEGVTAQALGEDPTVCLVEFAFSVAHGLSQIWLSAHITV